MPGHQLKAHIRMDETRVDEGKRSAAIEIPGHPLSRLEFESYDGALSSDAGSDAFLLGALLLLMEKGVDVHVHGVLSKRCVDNVYELQDIWARWRPNKYSKIKIEADEIVSTVRGEGPAISAFSGGADAAFTVQRHAINRTPGTANLQAVVFVHGFDIAENDDITFKKARQRGDLMLEGLGLQAFGLKTNLRSLGQDWEDVFGLAVASCLALYQNDFHIGLIGSSEPYDELVLPWGSSPVTDHLYGTGLMDLRHDGAGFSRTDKIASLASWSAAVRYLRVCWAGESLDLNCGKCEKCVRTYLNFKAAGVENPECFEHIPSGSEVRKLLAKNHAQINELRSIIDYAESRSMSGDWIKNLRLAIYRSRARRALVGAPGAKKTIATLKTIMSSRARF